MRATIQGKIQAARALRQFVRDFANWREVWSAYRVGRALPTLRLRDGSVIYHGPRDSALVIFREIWIEGDYSSEGFYAPKADDVILDVGGNIGMFAVWAAKAAPGVRVHAFEPAPAALESLRRNVAENGLADAVTIHPVGVSDHRGHFDFRAAEDTSHGSLFHYSAETETAAVLQVECVTLADAFALAGDPPRVAFLKVDVEGSEIEVFGAASPGLLDRVDRVAVEYHDLIRPGCRDDVLEVLSGAGFRCEDRPVPSVPGLGMIRATRSGDRSPAAGVR